MKKFIRRFLDVFNVRYCVFCGKAIKISDEISICEKCIGKCDRFGSTFINSGNTVVSALPYIKNVRKAMTKFKFNNKKYYGYTFGAIMYNRIKKSDWYKDVECIVCVPMRNRDRLYNQAAVIAESISQLSQIPFAENALIKVKDNPPFYKLKRQQRLELIDGAFKVENVSAFKGNTVLLVDDIYTTGVTANEAAKTLILGGAKKVYCATACYAVIRDVAEKIEL